MLAGAYSQRYKHMSDHHVNQLKERHQCERSHMLARARKVQMETNRRRRDLALKRKQEAQREEQRRQEILAKRKQQIREATERFQRANTHYQTIDSLRYDSNREQHQTTPALEEALKLVRGSPGLRRSFSYDGIAKLSNITAASRPHSHYDQTQNERIQEHVRQVAARTEMQSKSVRNLSNSRSLFEQQLENHQTQLHEVQRASLHQFNSAIHDELQGKSTRNEEQLQHSDSLSSIDSLEAERQPFSRSDTSVLSHKQQIQDAYRESPPSNPYPTPSALDLHRNFSPTKLSNAANNFTSRNSNSPSNIAVVQPNNAQQGSSIQNHRDYTRNGNIGHISESRGATAISGAKPIITNDSEFLKSYISRTQNIKNSTTNYAQGPSYYDSSYPSPISKNYDVNMPSSDIVQYESGKDTVKTRLKAWATPSPIDANHAQTISVTDNSMITNNNPSGVKATATNQTMTMNVTSTTETKPYSSVISHMEGTGSANKLSKSQPRVTEANNSRYLSGSYYTVKNYAEQSRPPSHPLINSHSRPVVSSQSNSYAPVAKAELVLEEGESDEDQNEAENEQLKQRVPPSPVKSILRKKSSYSDKLGVKGSGYSASLAKQRNNQHSQSPGGITANVCVKDSIEVARQLIDSRQDMLKPGKKSVRFADQLEEEQAEEEEQKEEEEEEKPINRRPPRPVSSKTSEAKSSKSAARMHSSNASAGRSGIPVTQNNNPVTRKPPPAQSIPKQSQSQPTIKDTKKSNGSEAKFDINGLRLDRTPTDDEINLLWDRVRDCLSRNSSIVEPSDDSRLNDSRNSAQVSQQRMTDNDMPQHSTPVHINGTNSYTNRKKVTMEHLTNYSAKKSNALQQQQTQNRMNQNAPSPVVATGYYAQPSYNNNKEVTDSMAAFLTAEMLSNRSTSASQINNVIDAVQSQEPTFTGSTRQQPKGHSALSVEEQRLLQSLEKLNERLRMTEHTLNPTKIYVPHPPSQIPTFRNQQAVNQRRYSGAQYAHGGKNFR